MSDQKKPEVECRLCRKSFELKPSYSPGRQIDEWGKVCNSCIEQWQVGRRAMSATKRDGKMVRASTARELPVDTRLGDPKGPTEITASDIITALGGVRTQGVGKKYCGPRVEVAIAKVQDKEECYTYIDGGSEEFQVQESRAKAMQKIVSAFLNAIAGAHVKGYNDGRNLLTGLASGSVSLETFSERTDNARVGKKPRSRRD